MERQHKLFTTNPRLNWRGMTLGMVPPAAHVTGNNRIRMWTSSRSLSPLAHHTHDAAVVRRWSAEQLERGYSGPGVRAVAELDQAACHARAHLARVVVIACAQFYYCSCSLRFIL